MRHRGPDDDGLVSHGDATIGMRRLAIFDPAHGHQPMVTDDGRFHLVFNGAIYNFRALRDELAAGGWVFRTQCDTEVLLAAYARWGEACLPRLRGMFAFAVWDCAEQSLFLARDPLGIKPLYVREDGGRLLFASELNALLASGFAAGEIDPVAVADYLAWFAVPAPRTIYRGIRSLLPGECARFRAGRLEPRTFWNFAAVPRDLPVAGSRPEFIRALRHQLDDTIRAHVVADVPVGAFLSGGLDSAAVVGLMSRAGGAPLRTFSLGFDEAGYSEAVAAAATARFCGAQHHASILTGAMVARDLDALLGALDQPTGDGVNTYYVSRAARAGGVTVALSGLGGDELFGGYPSFRDLPRLARWLPLWTRLPGPVRAALIAALQRGDTRARKLADFLQHARTLGELGALQRRVFAEPGRRALLSRDALAVLGDAPPHHPALAALGADLAGADAFNTISAWELRTYMADVLLRDSDVMSMRHSLELRVPFVDRPLVEWLWRQPAAFKATPGRPKSVLAEAVADLLPPGLAGRPKQGFSLPFAVWMRGELRPFLDDTFSDGSVDRCGLFARPAVQGLWRDFQAGSDPRAWSRVWSLAVLIAFVNRRTAAPAPAPAAPRPAPAVVAVPPPVTRARPTLLLAPEIFASEGGITRILQIYLQALCELAETRHGSVRLVALNDAAVDSLDVRKHATSRLQECQVCNRSKRRFITGALRLARGCDRILCGHVAQLPVAWAARRLNPRLRYTLIAHGIEVWRDFPLIERIALRGADSIFCVSDYTRRVLLAHCPGLRPERLHVVPNALAPCFPITGGQPLAACPPVIVTVARLTYADRYKGVEHLIAALPAVRATVPGAKLRIVGRGKDRPRLEELARQHGVLGQGVEFLGYLDDAQLAAELRGCRLFALPSSKEGFGLVFLEAMAQGRPVLGARAGGVPEVITPESGVLVEYGDIPGIAAALAGALQRPWDEAAIQARARHFSYSQFQARLASLLPE